MDILETDIFNRYKEYQCMYKLCNNKDCECVAKGYLELLSSTDTKDIIKEILFEISDSGEKITLDKSDILQFSNTWDNYALSIMFLRILIGIHRTIDKKNKFIILFMKLLVSNIHLNPLKRLSIDSTTKQFNNLLDSLEPNDYKEVINLMST